MLTLEQQLQGKTISLLDAEATLRNLNPDITVDKTGRSWGRLNRYGLMYKNRFITNVENDVWPEHSIWDSWDEYIVPATAQEYFTDTDNTWATEIWCRESEDPQRYRILDLMLGPKMAENLNIDGKEVGVVRYPNAIVITSMWKFAMLPSRILKIGWREVFDALVEANIPNITAHSLSRAFKVDYVPKLGTAVPYVEQVMAGRK